MAERVGPAVDFLCPSIYAFTPTEDHHWTIYAEANLLEALRVAQGKPVWPIHWSLYHDGAGNMTLPVWTRMVEFITTFPGINNLLAGLTVKFSLVNSAGVAVVTEATTGVSITDAATGKVQYDFQTADVTTAGTFYGWFTVYSGTEHDTYPAGGRKLVIEISARA